MYFCNTIAEREHIDACVFIAVHVTVIIRVTVAVRLTVAIRASIVIPKQM